MADSITADKLASLVLSAEKNITVGNLIVGATAELTIATTVGATTITVDSTADFTDTGTVLIGGSERFIYTSKTATTFVSTTDTIQAIFPIETEVIMYTVKSGTGASLEGSGRFAVGNADNAITFDGDVVTISGVEIDANDLANLSALDGKVSASLQTYADNTAYASGNVVIGANKLIWRVKAGQTVPSSNTTDPIEGTLWEEISSATATATLTSLGLTATAAEINVSRWSNKLSNSRLNKVGCY